MTQLKVGAAAEAASVCDLIYNVMLFSLVFGTRKRIDLLEGLFNSLVVNTNRKDQMEVFSVYDDDDEITHNSVTYLTEKYSSIKINFIRRARTKRLNEDYINYAARLSTGKFVFVLNDDTLFETLSWDTIAEDILEIYLRDKPDRIVYGMIDDSMDSVRAKQKLMYTGFPILSREAVNALGYAMPPGFNSWGADIYLYNVYNAVHRICNVRAIRVLHVSHHVENRVKDDTALNVEMINNDGNSNATLGPDIQTLANAVGLKIDNQSKPKQLPPKGRNVNVRHNPNYVHQQKPSLPKQSPPQGPSQKVEIESQTIKKSAPKQQLVLHPQVPKTLPAVQKFIPPPEPQIPIKQANLPQSVPVTNPKMNTDNAAMKNFQRRIDAINNKNR